MQHSEGLGFQKDTAQIYLHKQAETSKVLPSKFQIVLFYGKNYFL